MLNNFRLEIKKHDRIIREQTEMIEQQLPKLKMGKQAIKCCRLGRVFTKPSDSAFTKLMTMDEHGDLHDSIIARRMSEAVRCC